ncbi:MAG: chorismate mutase [Candidatus Pacearchaeota archaeon]|nr:chorismate mutase [Candidatus Pacearchaeota archaeon]
MQKQNVTNKHIQNLIQKNIEQIKHVYLEGAIKLRPDLIL